MRLSLEERMFGIGFKEAVQKFPEPPATTERVFSYTHPISGHSKTRTLEVPNKAMREVHKRLLRFLRTIPIESAHATGCKPGNSPKKNVSRHAGQRYFYLVDLKSAFHAVDIPALAGIFRRAARFPSRQEPQILTLLKRFCASRFGGLAEGLATSSDLFNLYCAVKIDKRLGQYCAWWGIRYTRYADDLVFSSDRPIPEKIRRYIRQILAGAGFDISHHKCRLHDLARGTITINGVGLRRNGRIFAPRRFTGRLQHLLYLVLQKDRWELLPQVHGCMGVFLQLTDTRNPNRTEERVLDRCTELISRRL